MISKLNMKIHVISAASIVMTLAVALGDQPTINVQPVHTGIGGGHPASPIGPQVGAVITANVPTGSSTNVTVGGTVTPQSIVGVQGGLSTSVGNRTTVNVNGAARTQGPANPNVGIGIQIRR
jgi:hypothetical protein